MLRLDKAIRALGLEPKNLGAVNQNERGEDIYNQCFYLSLARQAKGEVVHIGVKKPMMYVYVIRRGRSHKGLRSR